MLTLGEIAQLDIKGQFRSDVQLSDYDNPSLNLSLLQSYIFSTSTPDTYGRRAQAIASLDLLKELIKAYSFERFGTDNRFVAIANYGHGKSHLALVLANYFARPHASQEVETIFERIKQTCNDPALAEHFQDFKKERGEFLVIRLRGDTPRPLREQFFPALQQALGEHAQTRVVELPFWAKAAAQYLRSLSPEMRKAADDFLRQYDQDVPSLLQEIEEYREQAYDHYVEVFAHLSHGVRPSAEGHVSLSEAIHWVVDNYCGENKPLGGLLILFDEFSLYVQRYAQSRAVGELQDLLQGVENHPTKAIFLAFAQHDPDDVAEQTLYGGQTLQSLKKELQRLPRKYALYSLMESVLDSYLKQPETTWSEFLKDPRVRGALLGEASEITWKAFHKHYNDELKWSFEKFREVVTRGCFPLHPMTTAMLCQIKVQQGEDIGTARTALGFVRDQLEGCAKEPAQTEEGRVNWILPIALVDYFEQRLAGDSPNLYAAYDKAQRDLDQVFGEKATPIHRAVLKALLLQEIARLSVADLKQRELLASMCGYSERDTLEALKELSGNNITRYDPVHRINSFWPVGADPRRLETAIKEEVERGYWEPVQFVQELNRLLQNDEFYRFGSVPLEVKWGHSKDWGADEYIITPDVLTKEILQKLLPGFRRTDSGLEDGKRGLVLWVLIGDRVDRETLRQQIKAVLAEAWPEETPPPVLVMIPRESNPETIDLFKRITALEKVGRNKELIKEIGQQTYDQEKQRTKVALSTALGRLRGDSDHLWDVRRSLSEMVVPLAYQAAITALPGLTVQRVLTQLYEMAYQVRPPEFFTQYSAAPTRGQNKLGMAVKTVARNLLHDRVGSALSGMDPISKDLCEKYLANAQSWGFLAPGDLTLQKPTSLKLERAWLRLDITIEPGAQDVGLAEVVPTLLNPPYGFDYNTATLLLCGWIGYYRAELRLSARGQVISLDELEGQIERTRTSRDFLNWACTAPVTITRRSPDATQKEAQELIGRVNKRERFSQAEAQDVCQRLNEFAGLDNQPSNIRQRAARAAETLEEALSRAQEYDSKAKSILARLNSESDIAKLLDLREGLKKLPVSDLVRATQPAPNEIEERLDQRLEQTFEGIYRRVEALVDITQVGSVRQTLDNLKRRSEEQGLLSLAEKLAAIQDKLEQRATYLKAQEQEASVRKEIEAMDPKTGLAQLRLYLNRLQEIEALSEDLKKERDNKLRAIQREIKELEEYAGSIVERVQGLEVSKVDQERDGILRCFSRYEAEDLQSKLVQAQSYLDVLRQYLSELETIGRSPSSPEGVRDIQDKLEHIAQHYNQKLSTYHLGELEQVRRQITDQERDAQQKAILWLETCEGELEQGTSLDDLKRKLDSPPTFLPPDYQPRLEALRNSLQARLDQDHIAQIEMLFRELGTPEKRQECLARLQRLAAEEV